MNMSSFIEKIKKRSHHRRQGSSASQRSNKSNDSSSIVEFVVDGSTMPESPSMEIGLGGLTLMDTESPTTISPIRDFPSSSDLGVPSYRQDLPLKRKSRLSRTLTDILGDPSALGYFLTFMESKSLKHVVKFWLEAETFRISASGTLKRLEEQRDNDGSRTTSSPRFFNGLSLRQSTNKKLHVMRDFLERINQIFAKSINQNVTEQDAVAIYSKYLSKETSYDIGASECIRKDVIDKICPKDGSLDPNCFAPAQIFIFNILQNRYYPEYLKSVQYCKHLLEVLSESPVLITDILYDETALFHFVEVKRENLNHNPTVQVDSQFMEQEHERALIEFWLAAQNFHDKLTMLISHDCYEGVQAQNDAMVLYDKYFSMQATQSLGFSDDMRIEIEGNICQEDGPSPDCFEKPLNYILQILNEKYLPKFLNSNLFAKYLSELKNTAENDLELPPINGRRQSTTGSDLSSADRSSGASFSSTHLINSGRDSPRAAQRRQQMAGAEGENLTIDTARYTDPLWKREKTSKNISYVNELGKYVTMMEQEPGHKRTHSGGKIKGALKKLVSGDEKKEQELAEKMAELIVNDIRNMTKIGDIGGT